MKLEFFCNSDKGKKYKRNEDGFTLSLKHNLCIICDGVGTSGAGDLASKIVTSSIVDFIELFHANKLPVFNPQKLPLPALYLTESIQLSNYMLCKYTKRYISLKSMNTTVCAALFNNNTVYISHVGDTRAYCLNNDKLSILTKDHSYAMSLLEDKEIDINDLSKFKDKNIITRALGTENYVKIDLQMQPVTKTIKLFLLCTDGLWSVVEHSEIERVCVENNDNPEYICNSLIKAANDLGGPDNITVAVIKVAESAVLPEQDNANNQIIKIQPEPGNKQIFLSPFFKKIFKKYLPLIPKEIKLNRLLAILKKTLFIAGAILIIPFLLIILDKFMKTMNPADNQYTIKINNYIPETKIKLYQNNTIIKETEFPIISDVQPGKYQIKLIKSGFSEKDVQVMLITNSITIDGNLELLPKLVIKLDTTIIIKNSKYPEDSVIYIDNNKTDVTIKNLSYGDITLSLTKGLHTLSVRDDKYTYWEKTIDTKSDKNEAIINSYEYKKR